MNIKNAVAAALSIAAIVLAPQAHAQWSDNFDSYTAGTAISGQGGWSEWFSSTDVSGHVSNLHANSMPNSLEIVGNIGGSTNQGDDTVHTFTGATSGQWTFRIMTFVPTNATGPAYIILMNTYPPGAGNQWWSVEVQLNADTNTVYSDHAVTTTLPLVRNAWVEFRVEVDLTADTANYFYNGTPLATNVSWRNLYNTGGAAAIAALDLYAGEPTTGTTGTYFDDASLMPASTTTTINPTSTTLAPGIVISGTPADMFTSNDMYYVLRPGVVISSSQSPIVLTLSGTAPGNTPSDLKMVVESKSNQANIRETIESFNFSTSSYDQINQTVLTLSDVVKTLTITNPAQHVGPGNEVRTKISYKAVGPILSYPWRISIDEATWRYTP